MLELRSYQEDALQAIDEAAARGVQRPLIVHPTGAGKTVEFAHLLKRRAGRGLVLVHTDELVNQTVAKLRMIAPELSCGVVKAERDEYHAPIVVASVQTASRPDRLIRLNGFQTAIVDECFPAGTHVGGLPIEAVREGDLVESWDEEARAPVRRRVVATMRSKPSSLVRVSTDRGSVVCTPGHPFLTAKGWVVAGELRHGALIVSSTHDASAEYDLHRVRLSGRPHGEVKDRQLASVGTNVLLGRAPRHLGSQGFLGSDGTNQPPLRCRSDARAQPDAQFGVQGEDGCHAPLAWASAQRSRWQRQTAPGGASDAGRTARLAHRRGLSDADRDPTLPLQAGHRAPDDEGLRRGGWRLSRIGGPPGVGRTPRRSSQVTRVAGVQVLQPGRDGTYGGLCPGGVVYNLEVEGTHTYRVGAAGLVAHNCHHAAAPTWRRVLQHIGAFTPGGPLCAGFTATPERSDGGLGSIWQEIVAYRSIREMVYDGYLCEPVGERVDTAADLAGIRKSAGDLGAGAVGAALVSSGAIGQIATAVLKYASDRKTVAFTPTVVTAQQLAQAVAALGIPAEHVSGETDPDQRRAILRRLGTGETHFVANCAVLTEGFDEPSVDCICIARPTASHALYVQMVGRGLRPYPGKVDCLILDVVGATERHDLIGAVDLDTGIGGQSAQSKTRITVGPAVVRNPCELCGRPLSKERIAGGYVRHANCKAGGTARAQMFSASRMSWLEVETGFCLAAGEETVVIVPTNDEGDLWHVVSYSPKVYGGPSGKKVRRTSRVQMLHRGVPVEWAQGIGEDRARAFAKLAERGASWRRQRPSQAQLSRLVREGLPEHLLPRVTTRGAAADLMTRIHGRRAIRGMLTDRRYRKG